MRRKAAAGVGVMLLVAAIALWLWHGRGHGRDERGMGTQASPTRSHAMQPADQRASILGKITDESHAAVHDARVCADVESGEVPRAFRHEPHCAVTDEQGAYVIDNLYAATYVVAASARAHRVGAYRESVELADREARNDVDITLEPGGVELTGTVTDITGGPISGATVAVSEMPEGPSVYVITNASGSYSAWCSPGSVAVSAEADGYASRYEFGGAPGNLDVQLTPASTLSGTVIDAQTNAPVAGVSVEIARPEDLSWSGPGDSVTDNEGRFEIGQLTPDRYRLLAHSAHGFGASEGSSLVGLGQRVEGVVVKLYPAYEVAGRVEIAGNPNKPCKSPGLLLGGERETTVGADAHGSPDGTVRAGGLLPGTYAAHAGCDGYASSARTTVTVKDRDVVDLTWTVVPGARIRGRVLTKSGEPVEGARIVGPGMERSARDGTYLFDGVDAGPQRLFVESSRGTCPHGGWSVDVAPGATVEKDLVLDEPGVLDGTVVDSEGHPARGAQVWATAHGDMVFSSSERETRTSEEGRFHMPGLAAGTYEVTVLGGDEQLDKPPLVDVAAGRTSTVQLKVVVRAGGIHGVVTDPAGIPVSDAYVVAARDLSRNQRWNVGATRYESDNTSITGLDGRFTITRLPAGEFTVRAFRNGGGETFVEHVTLGSDIKLQLKPTGSAEGVVRGAADLDDWLVLDVSNTTGLQRTESFFRGHGRFVVKDLPAGAYVLTLKHMRESVAQRSFELADGEHKTNIDFDINAGVAMTGRIVDVATRQPVPGIEVRTALDEYVYPPPTAVSTDAGGRFRIDHVPTGRVYVFGTSEERTSRYANAHMIVEVEGTHDIDVGDVGIVKLRAKTQEEAGSLGITWVDFSDDLPSNQRTFKVAAIDPAGPAAQTDLRVGDSVTSIDGVEMKPYNRSAGWVMMQAPPGTAIHLGLARGITVTVVEAAH